MEPSAGTALAGSGQSLPRIESTRLVRGEGRGCEVLMPHHDTVIAENDHVIFFLPHKRMVRDVERLFQVGATFF